MPKKSITSALDVIGWFCSKAAQNKQRLSPKQLQNMLFLAQMHHLSKHGRVMVPAMFVCYPHGFYEPTINIIIEHGLPLLEEPIFESNTSMILESVWQKYSSLSEHELLDFITSLNCWLQYYHQDEETIINPIDLTSSFVSSISGNRSSSATKTKIRLSQNGPVQVSPWQPRKVSNSSISQKKEG